MTAVPKPPHRTKPRPRATVGGVTVPFGELRRYVFERERGCFAKRDLPGHVCAGEWTLEHVTQVHSVADPRRDDECHCVILCHSLNGGGGIASHELREMMRQWLRSLYPTCYRQGASGDG